MSARAISSRRSLSAAVGADVSVDERAQPEHGDQVGDPRLRLGRSDRPQPGVQFEVRAAAEVPIHNRILEDHTAHAPCPDRLLGDVEPRESRGSAARRDRRAEHPDRRRLTGSVRAEEPEHLTGASWPTWRSCGV
jgi:hypothetical protein